MTAPFNPLAISSPTDASELTQLRKEISDMTARLTQGYDYYADTGTKLQLSKKAIATLQTDLAAKQSRLDSLTGGLKVPGTTTAAPEPLPMFSTLQIGGSSQRTTVGALKNISYPSL